MKLDLQHGRFDSRISHEVVNQRRVVVADTDMFYQTLINQ